MISLHCATCLNKFFTCNEDEIDVHTTTFKLNKYEMLHETDLSITADNIVKCIPCKRILGYTINRLILHIQRQNFHIYATIVTRNIGSK